ATSVLQGVIACSSLQSLASRIPALWPVDGIDRGISNNGGVPDRCTLSALGLRGRIRGDKNLCGRRDAGASSSASTKSSGCSNSRTNTGT
nr:hypothetical protein [Tanacetum cinerariifolium]